VQGSTQGMPQLSGFDHGRFVIRQTWPVPTQSANAAASAGYYDGLIFHRVVPGFIAQTGDPSGTGMGGESYYGEPFENETHSRLKFNRYVSNYSSDLSVAINVFISIRSYRRGLVAFANNGDKRSNTSQWFITLGKRNI
jgi:peptidyl-prolyl cis-trans isomerase SDCCAG10